MVKVSRSGCRSISLSHRAADEAVTGQDSGGGGGCGNLSRPRWFWQEKLSRTGVGDLSGSSAGEDDCVQPIHDRLGERDGSVASPDDGRVVCMPHWG
jgi:hypothetical protein